MWGLEVDAVMPWTLDTMKVDECFNRVHLILGTKQTWGWSKRWFGQDLRGIFFCDEHGKASVISEISGERWEVAKLQASYLLYHRKFRKTFQIVWGGVRKSMVGYGWVQLGQWHDRCNNPLAKLDTRFEGPLTFKIHFLYPHGIRTEPGIPQNGYDAWFGWWFEKG